MKRTISFIIMILFAFVQLQAQVHYQNTTTNNTNSSAIGYGTIASGEKSFASGLTSTAEGVGSTTMGIDNLAIGHYSITLGSNLKAMQDHAIVIGSGNSNYFRLTNNNTYSLMIGFRSQYPTMFVSTSPTYDKTGKIGIGNVTNPQAKLHLRADDGEEAAIFIEPHSWESGDTALLKLGNQEHFIAADIADGMIYYTQKNHVFKGGDIYIEDIDKGIIMKSPDGRCWRGKLNNNGSLSFTVLESCPGHAPSAIKNNKVQKDEIIKIYPNPAHDFIRVEFLRFSKNTQVQLSLYNQNGQQLLLKNVAASKTLIYIGNLKSGVYFVKGTINGQTETKKIVKK